MISSLGSSIISLYARALGSGLDLVDVMGYEFAIDNEDDLITDLGKDPFISTALSSCLCEVYCKYGNFLAPITGAIISAKHFKIKNTFLHNKYDGTRENTTRETDTSDQRAERGDENTD